MFRKAVMLGFWLAGLLLALPAVSAPVTVQSVLFDCDGNVLTIGPPFGAAAPCGTQPIGGTPPVGTTLPNGDFLIFQTELAPTLGDGVDERTRGLFDFRPDGNYSALSDLLGQLHGKIVAATLDLVLTPLDPLTSTDQFSLENQSFTGSPEIGLQLQANPFLANGISKLVTLNLLDFYSQEQLKNFISGGIGDFASDGRIILQYGDDAIVSGAALRLTANVPEPATLALLALGLAGLAFNRRRKQ